MSKREELERRLMNFCRCDIRYVQIERIKCQTREEVLSGPDCELKRYWEEIDERKRKLMGFPPLVKRRSSWFVRILGALQGMYRGE